VGVLQAEVHAQAAGQVGQVLDVVLPVQLGHGEALLEGAVAVGVVCNDRRSRNKPAAVSAGRL
jgi:hypothetical protein